MGLDLVPTGNNPPDEINVVIEIPKDAEPVTVSYTHLDVYKRQLGWYAGQNWA